MFRGVNENDANASLRSYAAALSRDAHLAVDPNPILFDGLGALRTLLRDDAVDTISLTVDEYLSIDDGLVTGPLMIALVDGQLTEEYLLVVHRDSPIVRLANLRNHRLLMLDSVRASIAPHWLEVLLASEGLGLPAAFFADISRVTKPARVALPVFFHQEDACVITRRGLDLIGELNPQVGAQLRILATSPKIVPALTCFRANYPRAQTERVSVAVSRSHLWPAGKQVMTIFQCDRVEAQPLSALNPTRDLWTAYRRFHGPDSEGLALPAAPPPLIKGGSP